MAAFFFLRIRFPLPLRERESPTQFFRAEPLPQAFLAGAQNASPLPQGEGVL